MHAILTATGSRKHNLGENVKLKAHSRYGRVDLHPLVNKDTESFDTQITFAKGNTASDIGFHRINAHKIIPPCLKNKRTVYTTTYLGNVSLQTAKD